MSKFFMPLIAVSLAGALCACSGGKDEFKYTIDNFGDSKIIRYKVPGWDKLTPKQKEYAYHLSEAAKWGRDILWDQNCEHNIELRHALEAILEDFKGDRNSKDFKAFEEYAKKVFFNNGIHHHYSEDKVFPECSKEYFANCLKEVGKESDELLDFIYNPDTYLQRRCTNTHGDIVKNSSVNFYKGVTREEVERYYESINDADDPHPISYGLNTKVVKENGVVLEKQWRVGGIYDAPIRKICQELELASKVAENNTQKRALGYLIEYYHTGDLRTWDKFNIEWLKDTTGTIDFVNGFIEDYNDPLGRKGAWEGHVNIKDVKASERAEILSRNAQWFEDNSPIDPNFKKKAVKGVSAKVINAVCLSGDAYPATPIGINLPNADWIRKEVGSKSVTIANITEAYEKSAQEQPSSVLKEFAWDEKEIALDKKYGSWASNIHTDLHECLGHGSGQILPGVSTTVLGEYSSTLEEARADLFGLYYAADHKLVELGIMPDDEAYKAEYNSYIRNGIMVQFNRIELGRKNTEAHMQNRKLIAEWCYEKGWVKKVIEMKVRNGKTYFVINDYKALRELFAELLKEIQRIKSEGDFAAGKALVEKYAVEIDQKLHREVIERYAALHLKPYGGFVNPTIVPVEHGGEVVDYEIVYPEDYLAQMLEYGRKYGTLGKNGIATDGTPKGGYSGPVAFNNVYTPSYEPVIAPESEVKAAAKEKARKEKFAVKAAKAEKKALAKAEKEKKAIARRAERNARKLAKAERKEADKKMKEAQKIADKKARIKEQEVQDKAKAAEKLAKAQAEEEAVALKEAKKLAKAKEKEEAKAQAEAQKLAEEKEKALKEAKADSLAKAAKAKKEAEAAAAKAQKEAAKKIAEEKKVAEAAALKAEKAKKAEAEKVAKARKEAEAAAAKAQKEAAKKLAETSARKEKKEAKEVVAATTPESAPAVKEKVYANAWEKLLDDYTKKAETRELLLVKYTGGYHAEAEFYIKDASNRWALAKSGIANVGRNGIGKEREGDFKTPRGEFGIRRAFGILANPGTKVSYLSVGETTWACDEPGKYYNQIVDAAKLGRKVTGEHMIDYALAYEYGLETRYNDNNVPGKGTAIFVHCKSEKPYTAGCIALDKPFMKFILQNCTSGMMICVYEK